MLGKEGLERNVKEWGKVLSRLIWMMMMLGCERWVFVAVYGPYEDSNKLKNKEERDNIWLSLRECEWYKSR